MSRKDTRSGSVRQSAPQKKKGRRKAEPATAARRLARIVSSAAAALFLLLCAVGDWYVHHPPEWLSSHRNPLTAPLEYLGNRTGLLTDGLGWTGHDAVYESDDPVPSDQVFFAGAPVRTAFPAPADIITLNRGSFVLGWSPSLRHPVWAAYHVPAAARFESELNRRPGFAKDRSVTGCPAANTYAKSGYDRGHMVPNRAIVTRFGPDEQRKTFLMTNIAPQRPGLNRGPWRELEQRIADLWTAKYGEIWVIAGTVPGKTPHQLPDTAISVPAQFWMLIVAQTDEGVRALAVLLPQESNRGTFPVHNIVTINELEQLTGLELLPDMPKFLAKPLKADRPTRLWPVRLLDIFKLILLRFV